MNLETQIQQQRQIPAVAATHVQDARPLVAALIDFQAGIVASRQGAHHPFGGIASGGGAIAVAIKFTPVAGLWRKWGHIVSAIGLINHGRGHVAKPKPSRPKWLPLYSIHNWS